MSNDPTKWWDERLKDPKTFEFFVENLGNVNMPSRVAARDIAMKAGMNSVLDVGCGPAIDRWMDTGIAWHGVDGSYVLSDHNFDRGITIDQAPAHCLPYGPKTYDLVYSRHVWEHLPHYLPALQEACRVARRGVLVTFFRPPGSVNRQNITDGAYYNDYALGPMIAAFHRTWPGCKVSERYFPPQKFLPSGESILFVERAI